MKIMIWLLAIAAIGGLFALAETKYQSRIASLPEKEVWTIVRIGVPTAYGLLFRSTECSVRLARVADKREVTIQVQGSRCPLIQIGDALSTRWRIGNDPDETIGAVNFEGY